jgi:hypothetical protein
MKPKITKFSQAWWVCRGNGFEGYGITIDIAYKEWEIRYQAQLNARLD